MLHVQVKQAHWERVYLYILAVDKLFLNISCCYANFQKPAAGGLSYYPPYPDAVISSK